VVNEVELVELEQATELLGPAELLVTACAMGLTGRLTGLILLIFEDLAGFGLVDLLLHQPVGTTKTWGDLEQSAAKETINIVGCAYVNALAAHLPGIVSSRSEQVEKPPVGGGDLVPTPPVFVQEFAGSLLQFALMEQAIELDQLLLIHSQFGGARQGLNLNWTLLFIPSRESLQMLAASLAQLEESRR
jgi:chemotaxis protein CheC